MLFTKLMKSFQKPAMTVVVTGLALSSLAPLSANASVIETAGPTIVAPSGQWVMLDPGATRWYSFNYDLDQHADSPSEVTVQLESHVVGALSFDVKTSAMTSIGSGAKKSKFTQRDGDDSKLIWVGSTEETTHFYVAVKNETVFPSYYALTIKGDDITFPVTATDADPFEGAAIATAESSTDEASASDLIAQAPIGRSAFKATTEVAEAPGGMTAATALSPEGEWTTLGAGESRWYSFKYDYDQHASNPSEATIHLNMETPGSVSFDILDAGMTTFGGGTPKDNITGVAGDNSRLIWVGRTSVSGTYYVLVKNTSNAPASYLLDIAGPDVSF